MGDLTPWSKALKLRWKGKEQDAKARSLKKGTAVGMRERPAETKMVLGRAARSLTLSSGYLPCNGKHHPHPTHTPGSYATAVPRGTIKSEEVGSGPIFFQTPSLFHKIARIFLPLTSVYNHLACKNRYQFQGPLSVSETVRLSPMEGVSL